MSGDIKEKLKQAFKDLTSQNPLQESLARHAVTGSSTLEVARPTLLPEALPGLLGEFVELATEDSEADPAAVAATCLALFGIECGPSPHVMVGEDIHSARLFVAIVGRTAKARKGTSAGPVKRLFDALNSFYSSLSSNEIPYGSMAPISPGPLSSGEGLFSRVSDIGEGPLAYIAEKRLLVLESEFGAALQCAKRDGNTLSTTLRSAWDSGDIDILTKNNQVKCTGAHIGIVTHITVDELNQLLRTTDKYSGFANRFMWLLVERRKYVPLPKPMDEKKLNSIQTELYQRIVKAQLTPRMLFDHEAEIFWISIYPHLTAEQKGDIGGVIGRSEAQVIRLSLIYALFDGANTIRERHLISALSFWLYAHHSAVMIFGSQHSLDPTIKKIVGSLRSGPKTKTDISNIFDRNKSADDIDSAITQLLSWGLVKSETKNQSGKGRPATIYRLAKDTN